MAPVLAKRLLVATFASLSVPATCSASVLRSVDKRLGGLAKSLVRDLCNYKARAIAKLTGYVCVQNQAHVSSSQSKAVTCCLLQVHHPRTG